MTNQTIQPQRMKDFQIHLTEDEKSTATVEKYLRDCRAFSEFMGCEPLTKEAVIRYKQTLIESGRYAISSINSMLSSVNTLLRFLGRTDCVVKIIKTQRKLYAARERELTRSDYTRLLDSAQPDSRLWLLMQTICSTGVRVSEVRFFTVEAVQGSEITISCKGKTRTILLPGKLRKLLLRYCREQGITSGAIFRTRQGNPIDRTAIWAMMKRLAKKAGVLASKVFPHNLRHLFARTFYAAKKDMAALADVLGHSNINTTRIYIMVTAQEHQATIDRLDLVLSNRITT